jgi:pilus assembly protein Flp/PilA
MKSLIGKFLANESGATSIEYATIAVGVAVVVVTAVHGLGGNVKGKYLAAQTALN